MLKHDKYKACMLGSSLAGWAAACLLQVKGYPVVVLHPANEDPEYDASEFLSGFMLKPLLKRAGYHPSQLTHIQSLDVPFQWIDPERRFCWFTDDERFLSELKREFPNVSSQLHRAFTHDPEAINVYRHLLNSRIHLPPDGFFSRRQFFKVLQSVIKPEHIQILDKEDWYKEQGFSEDVTMILDMCQLALTSVESDNITKAELAHFLYALRWEGFSTHQGTAAIKQMLRDKLVAAGGVVLDYERVAGILWSGHEIQGLSIECKTDGVRDIKFDHLIIGGDPYGLIKLDEQSKVLQKWDKQLSHELERIGVRATKLITLDTSLVPVGLRPQGMFVWRPADFKNPETTNRRKFPRLIRYVLSPLSENRSQLALSYFINPEGQMPPSEKLDLEVKDVLTAILPFADMTDIHTTPWHIPNVKGKAGAFTEPYVYSPLKRDGMALETTSVSTPISNAFYAGKGALATLGMDGEILAGMHISNHITG